MKVDNIANSVINVINAPGAVPLKENTGIPKKQVKATVIEKDQDLGKAATESVDTEKLGKAIEVANKAFKEVNIGFKYVLNDKIDRAIVQVLNTETGEIIRQFPPEEIINMLERMYDLLGILIDKKA